MSGLTNEQTGAVISGSLPIQYKDAAGNDVDVTALTPLPTTSSGGGGGGSNLVQYEKGAGGVTTTVDDQGDALPVEIMAFDAGVTSLPKLSGSNGTAIIGKVNIAASQSIGISGSLPAGTNNIGDVDVLSLPAISGTVTVSSITNALPAGSNNIGDVDIASALPAGNNNIGNVDVATLPSLPAGNNNIGNVDVASLPSLPAGGNSIGSVNVDALFFKNGAGALVDMDVIANRLPVSDRPIQTVTEVVESNINAPGTPVTLLTCPANGTNWYQVRFAGIDRLTQVAMREFAFGVDRVNQIGNKNIYFPAVRVAPAVFNCSSAPFEPIADDFFLAPGDSIVIDSSAAGPFSAYIDYDVIA